MFHARDGLYFDSDGEGGNVTVRICEDSGRHSPVLREIVLSPDAWASVLASMCARGESAETFGDAQSFHTSTA